MKKILLILLIVLSIFSKPHKTDPNYIYGIYKVGDKITAPGKEYLGIKDGMIIQYIDPLEWSTPPVLSDDMQRIFCIVKHDRSWKADLSDAIKSVGSSGDINNFKPRKKYINFNDLSDFINNPDLINILRGAGKIIIDGTKLKKSILKLTSKSRAPPAYDYNAISTGSATVGSGGTYATWAVAFADVANLTGDLTLTQITATLEPDADLSITENLAGNTFTCTSNQPTLGDPTAGHQISLSGDNRWGFRIEMEGPGNININNLRFVRTGTPTSNPAAILFITISTGFTANVKNIIADGCSKQSGLMYIADNSPVINLYECIVYNCTNNGALNLNAHNNSNKYENLTFYNCVTAIDNNSSTSVFNNVNLFANTSNFINNTNSTSNNCATDAAGAAGVGAETNNNALLGLVAANEFISVLPASGSDFLQPAKGSNIIGAGTNPAIAGNTEYINAVSIIVDNVDIGAKGFVDDITTNTIIYKSSIYNKNNYKNGDYNKLIYNK